MCERMCVWSVWGVCVYVCCFRINNIKDSENSLKAQHNLLATSAEKAELIHWDLDAVRLSKEEKPGRDVLQDFICNCIYNLPIYHFYLC